jgi:CBS domain-containing protein
MKTLTDSRRASLACDVMTRNPLSINETASVREAAAYLLAKRMSAAPVINEAGRAVGVVSLSDVVRHSAKVDSSSWMDVPVGAVMNNEVLFVRPGTAIENVIEDLLHCRLKRLFVADENEVLVGVINATDVLRYLKATAAQPPPRPLGDAPCRRPRPLLPRRPAPFAATPRTGSDIFLAFTR